MTKIDTSTEAAEYVCRPIDEEAQMHCHNTHIAADMIRALLAERSRLRASLEDALASQFEWKQRAIAAIKETGK